ncbi:hypothetical protein EVJ58_g955 [Rhodofomes roseus]|uniref:Uncharacterized protein n=1 Tax=Rhodofomes roseus TaxID=34475 RepID=A0A4Y9Z3Y3_9APHY|nr:hypothetical protein EVJ58_g955 [Rhodofomes roseus]
MVNALSASAETGAPMACMYLLNHPDHYTSHIFKPFYWRSYKYEVMKAWTEEDILYNLDQNPVKVVIGKSKDSFVGISQQMDYIHRPKKYDHVSLYDWIRLAEKQTMGRAKKQATQKLRAVNEKITQLTQNVKAEQVRDIKPLPRRRGGGPTTQYETDSDDEMLLTKDTALQAEEDEKKYAAEQFHEPSRFLPTHLQYETHMAVMQPEHCARVPNFVGGSLPRKDKGNREEYCLVMLMLFKPWRIGTDLKQSGQSWDDAFAAHQFTSCQMDIMNFFHIRYECNDSRDDFSKQRETEGNSFGYDDDEQDQPDTDADADDYADIVQNSLTGDDGAMV